jgi:hypothetical protein
MAKPVTVHDVLDGHVALDLECLDRIYLNAYVPNLQVGGQVVSFLTAHLMRLRLGPPRWVAGRAGELRSRCQPWRR